MKYLRQLLMILIFSFIGEVLHAVIPIQMPASIYGLVLLFIALMTGLVKLPQVHEAARFLIEIMPLMFIPAGVGLIDSWGELRPIAASGHCSAARFYRTGYGRVRTGYTADDASWKERGQE